jgi:molybdopterin biosynthesis enzyme
VASTRVIPLVISEQLVKTAEEISITSGKVLHIKRFQQLKTGISITGNEVYYGLIEDKFKDTLLNKLSVYDCPVSKVIYCPDQKERIRDAIMELIGLGSELLLLCGGMSVDPDDVTRLAITESGATDLVYGTSILPGAMFLYARIGAIPVMGLPACVIYFKATVFDILLPRVLAGEIITRPDLARLAHGGLCQNCKVCHFPVCPFGKG